MSDKVFAVFAASMPVAMSDAGAPFVRAAFRVDVLLAASIFIIAVILSRINVIVIGGRGE